MAFFGGGTLMTIFITIFVLCIPINEYEWQGLLVANLYTFRFTFMVIFVLVAVAIDISIFKKYKVNYLFIFELDPQYKMTHI
jgi:hypothetical protein